MKVAIIAWHGLGDLVMLTAPIKRYQELHPDDEIHLFTLARFKETSIDLLSGLPFIKRVHPILKDAWNDFSSYEEGMRFVIQASQLYGKSIGIDKVIPTMCFRHQNEFHLYNNKMFRFAYDLEVSYTERHQFKPSINISTSALEEVGRFLRPYKRPYVVQHLQGGNTKKTLSHDQLPFSHTYQTGTTFEIGENLVSLSPNHIPIGIPNMEFTKALVCLCDRVIAIDSIVMHLAFAFEKYTDAIFTMTPAIQVVPLWKDYSSFVTFHCNPPVCGTGLDIVKSLK